MSQRNPSANPLRLAFLGHSCASAAAALAVLLDRAPMATTGVGAMPASPGGPQGHNMGSPPLSAFGRPGDAGIAPTSLASSARVGESTIKIVLVILGGAPSGLPGEPERLAASAGIPVVWVNSATETRDVLRAAAPDLAVAACFPWWLPRAAREVPPLGILNVHPSLLPIGRGAEPVFWTLRRGEQVTGVTLHRMDGGLDTGPIVAREGMPVPPAVRAPELENALMTRGARLLLDALPALADGELHPVPQREEGITHAPVPSPADWTIVTSLPAAWAWRFARGVAPLGGPLTVIAGGAAFRVADALDWSPDERLPEPVMDEGDDVIRVRFSPGWVRFRRAP